MSDKQTQYRSPLGAIAIVAAGLVGPVWCYRDFLHHANGTTEFLHLVLGPIIIGFLAFAVGAIISLPLVRVSKVWSTNVCFSVMLITCSYSLLQDPSASLTRKTRLIPQERPPQDQSASMDSSRPERVAIKAYWTKTIKDLALAHAAVTATEIALGQDDSVSASELLQKGRQYAEQGKNDAQDQVPDGYSDIGDQLYTAADDLSSALDDARQYLDDPKPSLAADSEVRNADAYRTILAAQHTARLAYVDRGGRIDDLASYDSEAQSADKIIDLLAR